MRSKVHVDVLTPLSQKSEIQAAPYFPALDGMRLLAIGAVVLHHAVGPNHRSRWMQWLAIQEGNGVGVPFFLILSGLLLTGILLNTHQTENRYRIFLTRRAVRIFPLYFGYLLLAIVTTYCVSGTPIRHIWIYATFTQSIFLHKAAETNSFLPLYHFWTLGVQEQFYLLWPLLIWSCRSIRQLRSLCWAGIVLSFLCRAFLAHIFGPGDHLVMLLPCRAGEMCMGGLLAVELRKPTLLSLILPKLFFPLALVYLVWARHGMDFATSVGSILGLQLVTIACGALISASLKPASLAYRVFASNRIGSIGKRYSYGIYVFHPMMLMLFALSAAYLGAARYPLMIAATATLVWVSYNLYEMPMLRWVHATWPYCTAKKKLVLAPQQIS